MTEAPIEETWSPEPVKAWRYWRVSDLEWNWSTDRFEANLIGDREPWDGPVKFAGHHKDVVSHYTGGDVTYSEVDHRSPSLDCLCGINAVKSLDWDSLTFRAVSHQCGGGIFHDGNCTETSQPVAVAEVELAGIVDEYEEGYRAEQGTIIGTIHLFNASAKLAEAVGSVYGLPAVVEDWMGPWAQSLRIETQRRKVDDGHRKADQKDHRGTGAGQDSRTGKRTRQKLRLLGWASSLSVWFTVGMSLIQPITAWWRWPLLIGLFSGGTVLIGRFAEFLSDR